MGFRNQRSKVTATLRSLTDWILAGALVVAGFGGGALAILQPESGSAVGEAIATLLSFVVPLGVLVLFLRILATLCLRALEVWKDG